MKISAMAAIAAASITATDRLVLVDDLSGTPTTYAVTLGDLRTKLLLGGGTFASDPLAGISTITTTGAINGQTISATASFTGTVAMAGALSVTLAGSTGISTSVSTAAPSATITSTRSAGTNVIFGNDSTGNVRLFLASAQNASGGVPRLTLTLAGGTFASPSAVPNGQGIGLVEFAGYANAWIANAATIGANATENWDGSGWGTSLSFSVTANRATGLSVALTLGQDMTATFGGNVTLASGKDLQLGRAASASVATASTHKIQIKDSAGATYYALVTT